MTYKDYFIMIWRYVILTVIIICVAKVATAISIDELPLAGIRVVSTMAELRNTIPTKTNKTVLLRGYYTLGDGGGGIFYWDASSNAADNGGTIINPMED